MDNRADKIRRRKVLNKVKGLCPICPLRDNENSKAKHRKRNHGQKPKYKNKRN